MSERSTSELRPAPLERMEENVLFCNALITFYLWLDHMKYMVNDHSDNKRGNPHASTTLVTLFD